MYRSGIIGRAVLGLLLTSTSIMATPITRPIAKHPVSEAVHVDIKTPSTGPQATVAFDCVYLDATGLENMVVPVPPNAQETMVWVNGWPKAWSHSSELYPMPVAEQGEWPMIEFDGPFDAPCVISVTCIYDLPTVEAVSTFNYPTGVGKLAEMQSAPEPHPVYVNVRSTWALTVESARLDTEPIDWSVRGRHYGFVLTPLGEPQTRDLTVSLYRPVTRKLTVGPNFVPFAETQRFDVMIFSDDPIDVVDWTLTIGDTTFPDCFKERIVEGATLDGGMTFRIPGMDGQTVRDLAGGDGQFKFTATATLSDGNTLSGVGWWEVIENVEGDICVGLHPRLRLLRNLLRRCPRGR